MSGAGPPIFRLISSEEDGEQPLKGGCGWVATVAPASMLQGSPASNFPGVLHCMAA